MYSHALVETFSTLTSGRLSFRISPRAAAEIVEATLLPSVEAISLTPNEMLRAMNEAEGRGVRGGAVYDFLHLVAAKKSGAKRLYTLNISDFSAFHRPGDPEIVHP